MKLSFKKVFPAAALMLVFAQGSGVFAQNFTPQIEAKLQWKLDSMKTTHDIQGISAAVFFPNQGFWNGTTGFSHAAVPISANMRFGIGSNTKLFTAVALLKLQESGLLSLDDSLGKWLPPMPNIAPEITLRQLLNHTSGVFDITEIEGYPDTILNDPNRLFQPEEVLTWVQAPLFAPGTGWEYSNTNYLLAGLVFEKAKNLPLEKFIRDSLLVPHGLNAIFFPPFEMVGGTVARPWQNNFAIFNQPRISLESAAWAAGAMYSTAEDLNYWYQYLLAGQIVLPASLDEMLTFVGSGNYGLGISGTVLGGRYCYLHGGSIRGYRSLALFDVASGAVVTVLCNELPAPAQLVAEALLLEIADEFPSVSVFEKMDENAVRVIPNPASGTISVNFNDLITPEGFQVQIFDTKGNLVLQKENAGTGLEIGGLTRGVYFLKIRFERGEISRKIVVE